MYYSNLPIDERLAAANLAITNALSDPEILPLLSAASYDAARLQAGRALYEQALALHQQALRARGDQYGATDALAASWEAAKQIYDGHLARARLVFKKQRGVLTRLGAAGKRAPSLLRWVAQARQFYESLLLDPALAAQMATFGVPQTELETALEHVNAVEAAHQARAGEQGLSQEATAQRNAALEALDTWMSTYFGLARQILAHRPQLLEKLGVRVRA